VVGIIGSIGAVRFNAWIWGFSSTANTAALTGGFMYTIVALRGHQVRVGTAVAGRGLQHSMTVKNALRRRLV
jgi:hypothetical protein